jgi:hypothetical protein
LKKIQVALIAFIVAFAFVYAQPSQRVNALVVSKAASLTAKKVAKDFIKESAKEIAFEMAMQAISQTWDSKNDYKFEETHYGFCADVITPDGKCTRVLQVKKDLTPYDIESVDAQLDIEIDKAITSGSGMTRWQKFMDWFLPIWIVSFALTALTYAIDGNVRDLFNEIAMKTLIALGIVKEAPLLVTPEPQIVDKTTGVPITPETTPSQIHKKEVINTTGFSELFVPDYDTLDAIVITELAHNPTKDLGINYYQKGFGTNPVASILQVQPTQVKINPSFYGKPTTIYKDDVVIYSGNNTSTGITVTKSSMPDITKVVRVEERIYKTGANTFSELNFKTSTGINYKMKSNVDSYFVNGNVFKAGGTKTQVFTDNGSYTYPASTETAFKQTIYINAVPVPYAPYKPFADDILPNVDIPKTKYENDTGEVTLVPPVAIPLTQTSTGQTVTVTPNPIAGEEPILTNEDGQPVDDNDVTADDPVITESPEGVTQVTPPSTSTNPNPVPIPLAPPAPPTEPPPPDVPPPPPEDGGGGKPNVPMELLLGLFKLLFAIIFYLIRMITFIVTIQFIEPIPIPNPYFIWFTTAEILGVQPYPLIKNIALFFLSFSIYKSVRRVFG